jgi:hypothetical protein
MRERHASLVVITADGDTGEATSCSRSWVIPEEEADDLAEAITRIYGPPADEGITTIGRLAEHAKSRPVTHFRPPEASG